MSKQNSGSCGPHWGWSCLAFFSGYSDEVSSFFVPPSLSPPPSHISFCHSFPSIRWKSHLCKPQRSQHNLLRDVRGCHFFLTPLLKDFMVSRNCTQCRCFLNFGNANVWEWGVRATGCLPLWGKALKTTHGRVGLWHPEGMMQFGTE